MSNSRGGKQIIPRPPDVVAGAPPPWADSPELADLSVLRERLARRPSRASSTSMPPISADAAVLVALHECIDGLSVVLTKRSSSLRTHRGEIAFPGGRQDRGEDLRTTALREAEEEIGLRPGLVEIVGELDRLTTLTSQSAIYPFVGVVPPGLVFVPNPGEVESVFSVPLGELVVPGVFHEELWSLSGAGDQRDRSLSGAGDQRDRSLSGAGDRLSRPVRFFELGHETVWGATATILFDLLCELRGASGLSGVG